MTIRKEIDYKQAMIRIMQGLPCIIEETRNQHGHPVFRYFLED